jgi:hypothetical protein
MIRWHWDETGLAFSLYAVKLSSRHRTSGWVDPGGKAGERGVFGVVCEAEAMMLHIGQPGLGVKAMSFGTKDSRRPRTVRRLPT